MKNRRTQKKLGHRKEDNSIVPSENFSIFNGRGHPFNRIKLKNYDIVDFDLDVLVRILENFQIKLNEL